MLYGGYDHTMDKKGRLSIPSRLREELGEKVVICPGSFGKCLWLYSKAEFDAFCEKIMAMPPLKRVTLSREVLDKSYGCEIDAQGRILVDPDLRTIADLKTDIHILGAGKNLEIWDKTIWEDYKISQSTLSRDEIMEEML